MLTSEEAELGIGRRVRNTETSQVGVLEGVKHRSEKNYWVGVVTFRGERDWVWLKKLEWVDGPPPTPTTRPRPYHDVLNALARYHENRKPEALFKLLSSGVRPPGRRSSSSRGSSAGRARSAGWICTRRSNRTAVASRAAAAPRRPLGIPGRPPTPV